MRATLGAIAPIPPKFFSRAEEEAVAAIDLYTAQYEVIRPELVEFFKTLVEDKITVDVRSLQLGTNLADQALVLCLRAN